MLLNIALHDPPLLFECKIAHELNDIHDKARKLNDSAEESQ